jgi:hypothetical protein
MAVAGLDDGRKTFVPAQMLLALRRIISCSMLPLRCSSEMETRLNFGSIAGSMVRPQEILHHTSPSLSEGKIEQYNRSSQMTIGSKS